MSPSAWHGSSPGASVSSEICVPGAPGAPVSPVAPVPPVSPAAPVSPVRFSAAEARMFPTWTHSPSLNRYTSEVEMSM